MTVVAIMAGLLPIMWSSGTGSEIMQRIAVPMIGGMVSSTALTLIVIPAIFGLVKGFRLGGDDGNGWRQGGDRSQQLSEHIKHEMHRGRVPEPAE
jgi:Cu(I)/Ag(I) efflux system membrane protein CusA/SilA